MQTTKTILRKKQITATELHEAVLDELEQSSRSLELLRDMAKIFWVFFREKKDRIEKKELFDQYVSTMHDGLQSYWGPSAQIKIDFEKMKFICTAGDGREVIL